MSGEPVGHTHSLDYDRDTQNSNQLSTIRPK